MPNFTYFKNSFRSLPTAIKESLSLKKHDRTQRLFIYEGAVMNPALVLTSGIFLSGYIILLGGSDFIVGLLNNSLAWASVVAIFSSMLFEKMRKRKVLLIFLQIISRLMVCSVIFLPLFLSREKSLLLSVIMIITGNILWSFYGTGINVWMMGAIPREVRKDFIYVRTFWLRITFTLFSVIMGNVLDWFNKSYEGFLLVFSLSLLLSLLDTYILSRIDEPENPLNEGAKVNLKNIFLPWSNTEYRSYLMFILVFYLVLFASSSFSPLYLIRYMGFDYKFITLINVIAYFFMIVSVKFWNKIEWKKDIKFVLKMGALFIMAEFFIFGFLTTRTYFLLYFSPILAGIGNGGFNIAVLNYRYDIMPDNNKTIYEAWFGAVYGLGSILAPVLGNLFIAYVPVIGNTVFQYANFQLLYMLSFFINFTLIMVLFRRKKVKNGS